MVENELPAGADAVGRGVVVFLDRMMTDPLLNWAFVGMDRAALERHANAFVVAGLGGPDLFVDRGMREAHAKFALRNEHFDAAVDHLLAALREVGISEGVVSDLAIRIEPMRTLIVSA